MTWGIRLLVSVLAFLLAFPGFATADDGRAGPHCRWHSLDVPSGGRTGFTLLPPEVTGIQFTNTLGEWAAESNRVLANGSGAAAGDFDGDGLPDLFVCGLEGRNVLYRNLGHLKFEDVTRESGIVLTNFYCRGATFADVNGDGSLDLLVAVTGQGVRCFLNDGRGHFSDQTPTSGLISPFGSVTLALADVDGNGTLDLYVVNNRTDDIRDRGEVDLRMNKGRLVVPPELQGRLLAVNNHVLEYGEPSFLYLNDGQGHFTAVSWTNGVFSNDAGHPYASPPLDWGLTASFRDINGDGSPDLYVCNDYWTPDRVWINDGHGHFRSMDYRALRNTSSSSMGVDFADLNQSGHYDFLVVDMLARDPAMRHRQMFAQEPIPLPVGAYNNRPQLMRNTLQAARGDGTFAEIAQFAGLAASDWAWCPLFLDVDLDGYPDVLITAGHYRDVQDWDANENMKASPSQRERPADPVARREAFIRQKLANAKYYPKLDVPISAFHNLGGYRFEEMTAQWGTETIGIHHALVAADFDGDGDLDLAVNNLGSPFAIYRNESSAGRVAVRLRGMAPNTQAIGSEVALLGGAVPRQHQEVVSGGRYMSGSDPELMFATGSSNAGMTLEVHWRSGRRTVVTGVEANRVYEISEDAADESVRGPAPPMSSHWFEDISHQINHVAVQQAFDDFARQPLLPRKLSQSGPPVAWLDLDGDRWPDLIVGASKGSRLGVFRNDQHGGFQRWTNAPWDGVLEREVTGLTGYPGTNGATLILAAVSNYEDGQTNGSSVLRFRGEAGAPESILSAIPSSAGPLAVADVNGDGFLDIFVSGRVVPGRYPESATSRLFLGTSSGLVFNELLSSQLERVGLVQGALWTDLDGDGTPELVLACEWGPIRVFRFQGGTWKELTDSLGLASFTGWWSGVAAGDFDGDGRLDLIVANWGLNSPYQASSEHPARLYFGEFSDRGSIDLVETEYDAWRDHYEVRRLRRALVQAIPDLTERFPSHRLYGEAPIEKILGPYQTRAGKVEARTLASMVFLNRGDHFEGARLPREAQWSAAFTPVVADFDGDGNEDVFLSQNFAASQPEVSRLDAGRGLMLRGDGTGKFQAVDGSQTGILVYGDQRGAAAADYDADGRVDLVVAQNGAETHLLHNQTARPGLRVRLSGPPGNPSGVGAVVRLKSGGQWGPAREIHGGSGSGSQDDTVQVLGSSQSPEAVQVRWPGGAITETVVGDQKEIVIRR